MKILFGIPGRHKMELGFKRFKVKHCEDELRFLALGGKRIPGQVAIGNLEDCDSDDPESYCKIWVLFEVKRKNIDYPTKEKEREAEILNIAKDLLSTVNDIKDVDVRKYANGKINELIKAIKEE
jgi:hypothetical protein